MQGPDATTVMLDQFMRVFLLTAFQATVQALVYATAAYGTVRLLVRHLEKRGY